MLYQVAIWHPTVQTSDFPEGQWRDPGPDGPRITDGSVEFADAFALHEFLNKHQEHWIMFKGEWIYLDTRMFRQR